MDAVLEHSEAPVEEPERLVEACGRLLTSDVLQLDATPQIAERDVEWRREPTVQLRLWCIDSLWIGRGRLHLRLHQLLVLDSLAAQFLVRC